MVLEDLKDTCPACGGKLCTFKGSQSDLEWKATIMHSTIDHAIGAVVERTKAEPDYRSREIQ